MYQESILHTVISKLDSIRANLAIAKGGEYFRSRNDIEEELLKLNKDLEKAVTSSSRIMNAANRRR